jgi:hypothetical protein
MTEKRKVYRGTTTDDLRSILTVGLPSGSFITDDPEQARAYAVDRSFHRPGQPIVLEYEGQIGQGNNTVSKGIGTTRETMRQRTRVHRVVNQRIVW